MSKAERVWISPSFNNTIIYARLRVMLNDQPGLEPTEEEMRRLVDMSSRYETGKGLQLDEIPTRFCGRNPDTRIRKLSDFFYANGFFVVSERCADVFRRFDLGTGGLHPVEIYQGNRKTRIEGLYFLLNFGCRKQAFLPEHSDQFHLSPIGKEPVLWIASVTTNEDDCAVSPAALVGCDLWIDPKVHAAFFLSDALAQALRAAKVTRTIRLKRCRVLDHDLTDAPRKGGATSRGVVDPTLPSP